MRKSVTVTIDTEGRDKGKTFRLTEMPASQAESWAIRALGAIMRTGADLPFDISRAGMAGMATVGLVALSRAPYSDVGPLLNELMDCVQVLPNPSDPSVQRSLIETDIEEIRTRGHLRAEAFKLHADFSTAGAKPEPAPAASAET